MGIRYAVFPWICFTPSSASSAILIASLEPSLISSFSSLSGFSSFTLFCPLCTLSSSILCPRPASQPAGVGRRRSPKQRLLGNKSRFLKVLHGPGMVRGAVAFQHVLFCQYGKGGVQTLKVFQVLEDLLGNGVHNILGNIR